MVIINNHLKLLRTFGSNFCLTRVPSVVTRNYVSPKVETSFLCQRSTFAFVPREISTRFLHNYNTTPVEMAAEQNRTLEQVERSLNNWLKPQILGESWDNIGLLVGSGMYEKNEKVIRSIMLCNDLMPAVLDEAISKKADMILAYHPPIFTGMKAVSYGTWKERIVSRCLANDICIYSPHTTMDSTVGGINDRVLNALKTGKNETSPIRAIVSSSFLGTETKGAAFTLTVENIGKLLENVPFQNYSDVLISLKACGDIATLSVFPKSNLEEISALISNLGIPDLKISEPEGQPIFGAGRIIELNEPMELDLAVEAIKQHLGLGYVQLAYGGNPTVKTAAVCVGSGSSLLKPIAGKIDLLITGEMSHHDILDCVVKKSSVILCNHCSSERYFLPDLAETLKVVTGITNIFVSEEDGSPLRLVL